MGELVMLSWIVGPKFVKLLVVSRAMDPSTWLY